MGSDPVDNLTFGRLFATIVGAMIEQRHNLKLSQRDLAELCGINGVSNMKKIISILLVTMIALTFPAIAFADTLSVQGDSVTINSDEGWDGLFIHENTNLIIDDGKTLTINGSIQFQDGASILLKGTLVGNITGFNYDSSNTIAFEKNGKLELNFVDYSVYSNAKSFLSKNSIKFKADDSELCITATGRDNTCQHERLICAACGEEVPSSNFTGSIIAGGNIAIVASLLSLVVGFIAGCIVYKKKLSKQ